MTIRKIKIFCFVMLLILFGYGVFPFGDVSSVSIVSSETTSSEKYIIIKGKKPIDAEIFGYLKSSDTNELCLKENLLSGTKYLSSFNNELQFVTYSDDGRSYEIKVPLVPKHANVKCDRKVHAIKIAAKSPGASVRYAVLEVLISKPTVRFPYPDITDGLSVRSVCQDEVVRGQWLKGFGCNYFNNDKLIGEMEYNSTTVTLDPDLFKAGTVITYDIIQGENYFPTLERPE